MAENALLGAVRAFQSGDAAAAAALMDPDVVWHSPGRRQPGAGTHRGIDDVLNAFGRIATAPGRLDLQIVTALTGGDGYEAVVYRHRRTREDASLDAAIALVARVERGRLTEVWEHIYDLFEFDDFYGGAT